MELRHLIYFEAVARHQHVTRAAEELMIAQPALSKQIRDLERDLGGVLLFDRSGRSVKLTEAGKAFLEHTRTILHQVEAARAELRDRAGVRRGRVAVGVPPTVGVWLLPGALAEFHTKYPLIDLRVREGGTQMLLGLLKSGDLDMAVVTLPVPHEEVRVTPLFDEELVIATARDHPLAARGEVAFTELLWERFLLYPEGYEMREVTLAACKRAGFLPRVVLDGGEMDMLLRLAEVGLGIALMPPLAMQSERLAAVRISDQELRRTMALVIHHERGLIPAALTLHGFLAEYLAQP